MYRMSPFYDSSAPIDLPTTMYKQENYLKPVLESAEKTPLNGPIMANGGPVTVEELERRQDAILERLRALRIEVDKLLAITPPTVELCCTATVVTTTAAASASSSSGCSKARSAESLAAGRAALQKAGLSSASLVDMVLLADPSSPPLSLFVLHSKLCDKFNVLSTSHLHSSVLSASDVPDIVSSLFNNNGLIESDRSAYQLGFTVVWKKGTCPTLTVKSAKSTSIVGEGNIARYLARILGYYDDGADIVMATRIDDLIDLADQLLVARGKAGELALLLATVAKGLDGGRKWLLGGDVASLADIVLWSAVKQSCTSAAGGTKLSGVVSSWAQSCASLPQFSLANQLV